MKSGVQMNFIERRASADRALSQLVRMIREETETLSSRDQGGVYELESTLIERSRTGPPAAPVRSRSAVPARWGAFWTVVLALVRGLWTRGRACAQRALARARVAWFCDLAPIFITFRVGFAAGGARLRKLRARERAEHEPRARDRACHPRMHD